jgi:hypothetical protein
VFCADAPADRPADRRACSAGSDIDDAINQYSKIIEGDKKFARLILTSQSPTHSNTNIS